MNALILGGSRFIGKRLARVLLDAGHRVALFNRGRTHDPFGPRVERLTGDRRSAADLSAAIEGRSFDAVFDLLCYDAHDARAAVDALTGKTSRFVCVSTGSVYWCTGDFPCPVPEEEFDRHPDEFPQRQGSIEYDYGYAKRQAEIVLWRAHRDGALPVTVVRPPIVGGPGDPSLRYAGYCERVSDRRPVVLPDGGDARFRHVGVDDLVRGLAGLPDNPVSLGRAYNLASAEEISVRTVVTSIAALAGASPELVDIPIADLEKMSRPGIATDFSPFTQWTSQVLDISRARRELGWSPEPWSAWMERAVRWWLETGRREGKTPPACAFRDEEVALARRFAAGR